MLYIKCTTHCGELEFVLENLNFLADAAVARGPDRALNVNKLVGLSLGRNVRVPWERLSDVIQRHLNIKRMTWRS